MVTGASVDQAAGILLVGPPGRCLLLCRADDGTWALPGGRVESTDETLLLAALRELWEETGYSGDVEVEPAALLATRNKRGLIYWSFGGRVRDCFEPILNEEHVAAGWFTLGALPAPLHPGVEQLFRAIDQAEIC